MAEPQVTPQKALITTRIIWAAMIMGVLMFAGVVAFMRPSPANSDAKFIQLLLYIGVGMLCVLLPMGLIIRGVVWSAGRSPEGLVAPAAFTTGTIIQLAMLEGTAFFALVGAMLNGGRGPHLIVAGIAVLMMFLSFPTGKPMLGDDAIQPIHKRN